MANKFGLDLGRAWRTVVADLTSWDVPDVLGWADYKRSWPEFEAQLETELDNNSYRPLPARVLEVPKSELMLRPIALLHPRDRVVYQALVAVLAPAIEQTLTSAVFSSRFDAKKQRVHDQRESWRRMQVEGRRLHVEERYGFMLSTDVVSYFEYIDLGILSRDLHSLRDVEAEHLRLLSTFLNDIERSSEIWGLPQGPQASFILGNFYLQPVDRVLELHPAVGVRFQDDIKVFANDESTLRRVLRDISRVMRGRRLNVSVAKTKILEGDEVLDHVEDATKDTIAYGIQISGVKSVVDDLRALFDAAVSEDPVNSRDIRFSVYRMSLADDAYAIPWILDNLVRVPFLAPLLVDYLAKHMSTTVDVEPSARNYLSDPGSNLYPWTELHLTRMFARAEAVSDETISLVWEALRDSNKDTLVREQAARCLGRHARPGDAALLRSEFMGSSDIALKRALLVAISESEGAPDKSFLSTVAAGSEELRPTAEYLRTGAILPPP
jgi:hypothetical protein